MILYVLYVGYVHGHGESVLSRHGVVVSIRVSRVGI